MPEKNIIRFEPTGIVAKASPGSNLYTVSARHMLPLSFDCGGRGTCGKCRVKVGPQSHLTPLTEKEKEHLSAEQIRQGLRLACQSSVCGDITMHHPDAEENTADCGNDVGGKEIKGRLERDSLHPHLSEENSLAEENFLSGENSLGLALDIGTTTLAAYLCESGSGEIIASASQANSQRMYGADVISRIAFADARADGMKILRESLLHSVNMLIRDMLESCAENHKIQPEDISEVCVVGNTTMQHIFAGIHPHCLGVSPYQPAVRVFPEMKAADFGLHLHPDCPVYIFPVVSGFVGGDTVGAALADAPYKRDDISLIMDIGTNGELVLSTPEGLWTASCATGPALEGAHISCGMRAVPGAVHQAELNPEGQIHCHVLDDISPRGICGSGMIDSLAVMRERGMILPDGRFQNEDPDVICDSQGIGRKTILISAEECASGEEIAISLKDVRQMQLAKAALSAGIRFLMKKAGVEQIDQTILTGAFGAHFDWQNAAVIGMIPPEAIEGEVHVKQNLAGRGALMALMNPGQREEALEISRNMRFVEMAAEPDFTTAFAKATAFPDSVYS